MATEKPMPANANEPAGRDPMTRPFDICCVGHMCTDVLIKPVDALPDRGKLQLLDSVHLKTGGCGMNASIGLAKLGNRVAMLGKVGKDGFGSFMRDALALHGVDVSGLVFEEGGATSASVVLLGSDGERSILHCLGTNQTLCFEDVDTSLVKSARVLFIGGTFLMPSFDGMGAARLLAFAKDQGCVTAMDTAWDSTGRWLDIIEPCFASLDWFMPSIEEAEMITGLKDTAGMADFFKSRGVGNVAIKLGDKGCYLNAGEEFALPPFKVECVDTAGSGDAWCSGFLTGLVRGMGVRDAARLGNAAGALCVTAIGTTDGLKDLDATMDFIREQEGLNEKESLIEKASLEKKGDGLS